MTDRERLVIGVSVVVFRDQRPWTRKQVEMVMCELVQPGAKLAHLVQVLVKAEDSSRAWSRLVTDVVARAREYGTQIDTASSQG